MLQKNLAIALSGGGIKAYCQVGILKALNEAGIKIDGYSGASMGAIIAVLAASGISVGDLEERVLRIEKKIVDDNLLTPSNAQFFPLLTSAVTGLIKPTKFRELLQEELDSLGLKMMKDIKIPLVITSVDLISGSVVIFTNRKKVFRKRPFEIVIEDATLIDALQASCSFPMVFETMDYRGMQLVDGGVLMNLPVRPLRQIGFEMICSVTMENLVDFKESKKVSDIAMRIYDITISENIRNFIAMSDFNINVFDKNIGIFSFRKGNESIELGYRKALEMAEEIEAFKIELQRFKI